MLEPEQGMTTDRRAAIARLAQRFADHRAAFSTVAKPTQTA